MVRLTSVSSGTAFFVHVHTEDRREKLREIEVMLAAFTPPTSALKLLSMKTKSDEYATSVVPVTDDNNADAVAEAEATDSAAKPAVEVGDEKKGQEDSQGEDPDSAPVTDANNADYAATGDNADADTGDVGCGGVTGNMSLIDELDTSIQRVRTLLTKQRQSSSDDDNNADADNDTGVNTSVSSSAPSSPKKLTSSSPPLTNKPSASSTSVPSSSSAWLRRGQLVLARVDGQKLVGGTAGEYRWYRAKVEEVGEEVVDHDSNESAVDGGNGSSSSGGDDVTTAKSKYQQVRVQCIDYGKRVVVDVGDLAVIDDNDDDGGNGVDQEKGGTTIVDGSGSSGNSSGGNGVTGNNQRVKYFAMPGLAVECCLAFLAPPPSPPILAMDGHSGDEGSRGIVASSGDGGDGYTLAVDVDEDHDHDGDDGSCVDVDGDAPTGYRGMLAMSNRAVELLGDEAWGKDMLMQVPDKTRQDQTPLI